MYMQRRILMIGWDKSIRFDLQNRNTEKVYDMYRSKVVQVISRHKPTSYGSVEPKQLAFKHSNDLRTDITR